MSDHIKLWVLLLALVIAYLLGRKIRSTPLNWTLFALVIVAFCSHFFVKGSIWGTWNAIEVLKDKEIIEIQLQPSAPNWKVNLVGRNIRLSDKKDKERITQLLQKVMTYSPSHPIRIWETKMTLITSTQDTLVMIVHQTVDDGTVVYMPSAEWASEELGTYLEKITRYTSPVYSDTSTTRH